MGLSYVCLKCALGKKHPWHDGGEPNLADLYNWQPGGRFAPPAQKEDR